jgi:hypothetical protein
MEALAQIEMAPVRGVTVDKEGAARAMLEEAEAIAAGFTPAPPIYAVGTMVVEAGVDNFRQSRKEFEALPHVGEACDTLIERVTAEQRRDVTVHVPGLTYGKDGKLIVSGLGALPMSDRAFEGLCFFSTPGGGNYLRNCGTVGEYEAEGMALRAANLNHWMPRALRVDKRATKKALKKWEAENFARFQKGEAPLPRPASMTIKAPTEVKLRLRQLMGSNGGEEIFGCVGPRYSAFDVDKIAEVIKATLADLGGRCTVVYNGFKASWDILFHSNIDAEQCVAGEFFKAGIRISTADDGSSSIKVKTLMFRNLCLNLIVIDVDEKLTTRRRHVGKNMEDTIVQGVEDAKRRVGYFAKKWSEASVENILDRYGLSSPEVVFERMIANKVVHVAGYTDEEMTQRLITAYYTEPGWGKTSYINAVTKAAHMHSWRSMDDSATLEEQAGALLFQPVWVLDEPKTEEQLLG